MKITLNKGNKEVKTRVVFSHAVHVGMSISEVTEEEVNMLSNIRHVGDCGFKGDIFIGERRDDEWCTTEEVVLFGCFE